MFVDQLSASPHHRLNQILHTLKHVHACDLPVHDSVQLQEWAQEAHSHKQQIVQGSTFNSYMQQPEYVKANLILEAVKMLTEVAPKRRKRVQEHKETQMSTLNEAKAKPDFLDIDKDGNKKEPMKQAAKQAAAKKLDEKQGKPDFLDLDKDGDRKEPMKQAAKQAKHKDIEEAKHDPEGDIAIKNYKGPITYGKTKKAKGSQPYMMGTYHREKTGSALADLPVRVSSIRKPTLKEDANLDKAQTLLAAQDISDRLQKMAEDAAKMAVDDLMPLVDTMKDQFGLEQATAFNNVVKQQLQTVLDSIIAAKDQTDNAINTMESGGMPAAPADIGQPLPPMGGAAPAAAPAAEPAMAPAGEPAAADMGAEPGAEGEIDFEQEFAASPATSGPEDEALGRAKKEVAEATLTQAQQEAQAKMASDAAAQMAKTRKKPDGTPATAQEIADAKKMVAEARKAKSPYAIGMAQAMKQTGDTPPLKKSTIVKAHKIAREIEKDLKEQQLVTIREHMHSLRGKFEKLKESHARRQGQLVENWIMREGDLKSAVIQHDMRQVRDQIAELLETYKSIKQELNEWAEFESRTQAQIEKLNTQLATQPYGVSAQLPNGNKFRKFFESQELRMTWINYNQDKLQSHELIEPSHVQAVQQRLQDLI